MIDGSVGRRLRAAGIAVVACIGVLGLCGPSPARAESRACAPGVEAARAAAAVRLDVHRAKAAGTTFAWAEVGSGLPLLLLNGTGSPMAEWDPALLAGLASGRRVIVFDYPGLGLSGPAPARLTFPRMADWTAALIDALGLGRVDVLGWSMGGFVAQQLAVRHPEAVRRLVLAATNPGGASTVLGPPWVQEADSSSDGSVASYLLTNYPRTTCPQRAGRDFVSRLTAAVNGGRYPDESVPPSTYDAMVAAEDPWLRSEANADALATIEAPTLVITGSQDVITPPANSRAIAKRVPGARLHLVPGAGHSFLFQRPLATADLLLGFLDG